MNRIHMDTCSLFTALERLLHPIDGSLCAVQEESMTKSDPRERCEMGMGSGMSMMGDDDDASVCRVCVRILLRGGMPSQADA